MLILVFNVSKLHVFWKFTIKKCRNNNKGISVIAELNMACYCLVTIHKQILTKTTMGVYIDGCCSVDHVNCSLVTPVNRRRQSDGYQ